MRSAFLLLVLLPNSCIAEIFYGLADAMIEVSQQELDSASVYRTLRTYVLPCTVKFRVETDFDTSKLLGMDINIHKTIYEDVSQNFGFSFGIEGTIYGPEPVDIDLLSGTDVWASDRYWDIAQIEITLARHVFNSTNSFGTQYFDESAAIGADGFNFSDFPKSIVYERGGINAWGLGSIPYSDDERLSFALHSPGSVSLAPAICAHVTCGDYSHDGIVGASDYILWRDTLNQTGDLLPADGNSNKKVETADYYVWRARYGRNTDQLSTVVPEPATWLLLVGIVACLYLNRR